MKLRLLGTAMMFIFLTSSLVGAATLTVTSPNPAIIADGQCSLIEAIINANDDTQTHADCVAGSGADTIVLSGITYTLTEAYDDANPLPFDSASGLPIIASPITIEGHGATIARDTNSNEFFRIFQVGFLDSARVEYEGNLTLDDMTVTGGYVEEFDGRYTGGGVSVWAGSLTLTNSAITGNAIGGIRHWGKPMMIVSSAISHNTGGGIYGSGRTTIVSSTVSGNAGAGIDLQGGDPTFINSTVSGNTEGGISVSNADVWLINTTIADNGFRGLFISEEFSSWKLYLINSIIAGGYPDSFSCESDNAVFNSGSLIQDGSCESAFPPGTDPVLGPLQDNGGPTETHALLAGSPAIDRGARCVWTQTVSHSPPTSAVNHVP